MVAIGHTYIFHGSDESYESVCSPHTLVCNVPHFGRQEHGQERRVVVELERLGEEGTYGRGEVGRGGERLGEEGRGGERRGEEWRGEVERGEEGRGVERRGEEWRGGERKGGEGRGKERRGEVRWHGDRRGEERRGEEGREEEQSGWEREKRRSILLVATLAMGEGGKNGQPQKEATHSLARQQKQLLQIASLTLLVTVVQQLHKLLFLPHHPQLLLHMSHTHTTCNNTTCTCILHPTCTICTCTCTFCILYTTCLYDRLHVSMTDYMSL